MSPRTKRTKPLSEQEIDQTVVAQTEDDAAWEASVRVQRTTPASLALPAELAARAAFLAQLHRTPNVEDWLRRVIQERVELEEAAFVGIKRSLAAQAT
jgi:hypothetical protein